MILQTAKEYLASTSNVRIAHLVEIELAGTFGVYTYLTDYQNNIFYNGQDYVAGKVVGVSSVRLTQGIKNYTMQVNIAGEYAEEIAKGISSLSYEGRNIRVYRAYLDERGAIIPFNSMDNGPVKLFIGKVGGVSVNEDVTKGSSIVTWECAGLLYDFEKVNGRITDDSSHRGLVSNGLTSLPIPSDGAKKEAYKTDTGFQHANQTISTSISYLGKQKEYYLKKSLFGLKSSLREREVTVTRTIDIKTSLEARHLPVVYGVRRLPGIPVFLDAKKSDPSRMYCVYAVCEGEIDAFLDVYVDGVSAICNTSTESTGVCFGNKQNGDTLSVYKNPDLTAVRKEGWEKYPYDRDNNNYDDEYDVVAPAPSINGTSHMDSFNIMAEKGAVWIQFFHGTPNQVPCPDLVNLASGNGLLLQNQLKKQDGSSWGPEYWGATSAGVSGAALLDTAYIVVAFSITEDRTELPNIEVVVSGKRPTIITSPNSYTTQNYSLNPVWHLLDYLTNPTYGGGLDISTEIDFESFMDVAAQLDTQDISYETSYVSWWRYIGWLNSSYSKSIMQCNTLISTENSVTKNVEELLNQFMGTLNPVNGKYHLSIENDYPAVASIDISEVSGRVNIKDVANKDKWNSIQASIMDPALDWSTNQITFFDSTYLSEDNGIRKKGNAIFNNITNYYTARAWAQRVLNISRFNRTLRFSTYFKYSWLLPNDIIEFTYPRLGYSNTKFRVTEVDIEPTGLVTLAIESYNPTAYTTTKQPINNPPSGPGSNVLPPANLDFAYMPNEDILISNTDPSVYGVLYWDVNEDLDVLRYEGWYGEVDGSLGSRTLISALPSQVASIFGGNKVYELIRDLEPNKQYIFKVQTIYNSGAKSPFNIFTIGTDDNTVPSFIPPVTGLRLVNKAPDGTFIGPNVSLQWDPLATFPVAFTYNLEFLSPTDSSVLIPITGVPSGTTSYTLLLSTNMSKYLELTGETGAYRTFLVRARRVSSSGTFSEWSYL